MSVNAKFCWLHLCGLLISATAFVYLPTSTLYGAENSASGYETEYELFRKILSDLVKADTTNPPGNEERAVAVIAARLKAEKIDFQTMEFAPHRQNIVARLKGSGEKKPILLLAHLDVVGTEHQAWTTPPHELTDKDGYLYGRGVRDDLGMAALNLETFIRIKKSGVKLSRDLILALTGDEESGGLGIRQLLAQHPDWINASIALNEGGGPITSVKDGPVQFVNMQLAEKTYADFTLKAAGETGHSSTPTKDNAIYRLSEALTRLGHFEEPVHLIPATRAYFKQRSELEKPELGKAMLALANARGSLPKKAVEMVSASSLSNAANLRTTCVATMLAGGTKVNALPAEATANVNCRILPDETVQQVQERLAKVIADTKISIESTKDFGKSGASPIEGEMVAAIRDVTLDMWPKAKVIPFMGNGASDSRFLREKGIDAYGLVPLAQTESDGPRMHGIDERIPLSSIKPGFEFLEKLILKLQ